jgi:hypothetical protein
MANRGTITEDQIATLSKHGSGTTLQMFGPGTSTTGHVAVFDSNNNVIDGGTGLGTFGFSVNGVLLAAITFGVSVNGTVLT